MSLFDFIAENFIIVAGAAGLAVTSFWNKIQPFLAKLLAPSPFPPLPPVVLPVPRPRPQPVPQPTDDNESEDIVLAVNSAKYLIAYFIATKNTKGETHARSAAKSIFEANADVASK